ncbi:MAG TPA: acyltransferase [Burkholderiaceae bacterium]|nr:acyltransferase [Burkholderiaceae bacterium]
MQFNQTKQIQIQKTEVKNRIFGLDLLRVYAIFSVVYGHGWYLAAHFADKRYLSFKYESVTIFFTITGFLVGYKFLKFLERDSINIVTVRGFWLKRFIKIYPSYFLLLVLVGVFHFALGGALPAGYLYLFTFTQNLISPHPSVYPELWSLAIQEWFYVLIPFIFIVYSRYQNRNKPSQLIIIVLSIIVAVTTWRIAKVLLLSPVDLQTWDIMLRKQVVTRLDSALYGLLVAYAMFKHPMVFKKYAYHALALALFLIYVDKDLFERFPFYRNYLNLSISSIGAALLIPYFYGLNINNAFIKNMITRLSAISLGMYILHLTPVMFVFVPYAMSALQKLFPSSAYDFHILLYAAYWVLSIGLAHFLHHYYAKPMDVFLTRKFNHLL